MNMHFRPKIQNGPVAKRLRAGSITQSTPRPAKSFSFAAISPIWSGASVGELAQSGLAAIGLDGRLQSTKVGGKEKAASRSRVLLGLIGCGVLLTSGFMFSLRDHFTAYAFGRDEVKLKSKIEQAETEQQHLDIKLKRAGNPQALEQAAREAGLLPLELERKKVVIASTRVTAAEKAKTSPSAKSPASKSKAAEH